MYVNYEYYKDVYKGSLVDKDSFGIYELKARMILDNYTLKPKKQIEKANEGRFSDNIKLAMCELIDSIKNYETLLETAKKGQLRQITGLASETVKDHTITIAKGAKDSVTELEELTKNNQIEIMRKYLLVTGLLFRGL